MNRHPRHANGLGEGRATSPRAPIETRDGEGTGKEVGRNGVLEDCVLRHDSRGIGGPFVGVGWTL